MPMVRQGSRHGRSQIGRVWSVRLCFWLVLLVSFFFAAGSRLIGAMDRMHRNLLTPREDIYTGKE